MDKNYVDYIAKDDFEIAIDEYRAVTLKKGSRWHILDDVITDEGMIYLESNNIYEGSILVNSGQLNEMFDIDIY